MNLDKKFDFPEELGPQIKLKKKGGKSMIKNYLLHYLSKSYPLIGQ